ncbi:GMP reductase [Candidatus Woesearchaeota archaeon]|nr:GMP reductase [Candidatus Woesearchaeota archaeon]
MRFDSDVKFDFQDVLIRPKRSTLESRKDVVLKRKFKFIHSGREWEGIPIMAANMDTTGTFEMAKELSKNKIITTLHKFYTIDELQDFFSDFNEPDYVAYTLGVREGDFEKLKDIIDLGLGEKFNFICLDVPNAYLECFVQNLQRVRRLCPRHTIIAGNVVTNEMTEELILKGADIVKIGIGSGSACTTRKKTGVGYPQLSAVIECADAAHGISNNNGCGLIISDGGAIYPSCVGKAFCGGADFAMLGGLFSGFKQSGGKLVTIKGKKYKEFYGMSSAKAMNRRYGGVAKHRASEGRQLRIPYKGDVNDFVLDLFGSLRSTGTYIGARGLKEFSRRTTFLLVNRQLNQSLERYEEN